MNQTPFSASELLKEAGGAGDLFKPQEGVNYIRLVSNAVVYKNEFKGKISTRFACFIIDRKDGEAKVYLMPVTVMKKIEGLQLTPDTAFTSVPMPYDINIMVKGAGSIDADYSVIPARTNTVLTEKEIEDIQKLGDIKEWITKFDEAVKNKEKEKAQSEIIKPAAPISPQEVIEKAQNISIDIDSIPFE